MNSRWGEQFRSSESSGIFRLIEILPWLSSPGFALMALLTLNYDDALCRAAGGTSWNGMATMYLLMCIAHLSPWLKLLSGRQSGSVQKQARN